MFHWKKATTILVISVLLAGTAAYASPQAEGGAFGGIIGGVAGALLDHKNPWRGGVIGAGLGAVTGAVLTDVSIRGAQGAAQNVQPVEYRSDTDRRFYNTGPVREVYYPDEHTIVTPPPYAMSGSPDIVLIPGTYVYAVPEARVPVLFYGGSWWRPVEGRWYRADHCNGPWLYVRRAPRAIVELPPDYPRMLHGRHRIAYGEWRDRGRHEGWRERDRDRWEDRGRGFEDR